MKHAILQIFLTICSMQCSNVSICVIQILHTANIQTTQCWRSVVHLLWWWVAAHRTQRTSEKERLRLELFS